MLLRIPALIRTILADVNAAASSTSIRGGRFYHAPHYHLPLLNFQPQPEILFKELRAAQETETNL